MSTIVPSRQDGEALVFQGVEEDELLDVGEVVETNVVRGQGYNALVGLSVSDQSGTLEVLGAPEVTVDGVKQPGTFVTLTTLATEVISGQQVVNPDEEVRADYVKLRYTNGAAGQGLWDRSFRMVPIFGFKRVEIVNEGVGANVDVVGNGQVQTVEAITLLAAAAVFNGESKDNINYEAMSASLTVASTLGTTVTVRFQQRAIDSDTFRDTDVISGIAVPVGGALVNFDRVWSVSRRFGRIQVENTGVNPLTTAELVVMQKPIS